MLTLVGVDRKSDIFTPSSLVCIKDMPAINLTSGCAHGCVYCYARGYSTYPGDNRMIFYKNTLEKLRKELATKRKIPKAVYFSPSSDLFQPVLQVKELGYSVLEFLLSWNIGVAFLTKGIIPDKTMNLLLTHADIVRAQIGIITADERIRSIFEPHAASTEKRLQQMKRLVAGGISVEARLMPILPGITDTSESLNRLFQSIAEAGVKKAAVSTLFLRLGIKNSLKRLVPDRKLVDNLLDFYRSSGRVSVLASHSSVVPLPRMIREIIYSRVGKIADKYSISISICGCMNPDMRGTCNIGGNWQEYSLDAFQVGMFDGRDFMP